MRRLLLGLVAGVFAVSAGLGGLFLQQATTTMSALNQTSQPPERIGDHTVTDRAPAASQPGSQGRTGGIESRESGAVAPAAGLPPASASSDDAAAEEPVVALAGDDAAEAMLADGLTFETAPALAAVAESEGSAPSDEEHGGGVIGSLLDRGRDMTQIARGATTAAGLTDGTLGPLTIMVMGVDAREGSPIDIGVRPDALMVLRLDPEAGTCRGLAVPRDSYVFLPGYGHTKINHALMVGGVRYQELVVESYLGIEIDRYALIDLHGFQRLVDGVGGITIEVSPELTSPTVGAGIQQVDGERALLHARYRGGPDGDFGRIKRQQQIMRGLIAAASGRDLVIEARRLTDALQDHVRTDLTMEELVTLATELRTTCSADALVMDQIPGEIVYGPLVDDLFGIPLSYVVSDPSVVERKVEELMQ